MQVGKILRRFPIIDGREVILKTPKREDLDDLIELINSLVERALNERNRKQREVTQPNLVLLGNTT